MTTMFIRNPLAPMISWVYRKNWQYDRLSLEHQQYKLGTALVAIVGTCGILQVLGVFFNAPLLKIIGMLLMFFLLGGLLLARILYDSGRLNSYQPIDIKEFYKREWEYNQKTQQNQKKTPSGFNKEAPKENPNAWKLPYLKILDLPEGSTDEMIKQRYRKLAMQYHPDRNKHPSAEAYFKNIKSAYEKLNG